MMWHRPVEKIWYSALWPKPLQKILSIPWNVISMIIAIRTSRKAIRVPSVVVSVGNLVSGGTGKTPFTMWLSEELRRSGISVAVVARSMGARKNLTIAVEKSSTLNNQHSLIFGDEPLLIKHRLWKIPLWVGDRKWFAALMAYIHHFPQVIVIDDGFQHRGLKKDLEFLLFDAKDLWGNGTLLPFGPLREPVDNLSRADVVVITGIEEKDLQEAEEKLRNRTGWSGPVIKALRKIRGIRLGGKVFETRFFRKIPICAFCAIARPDRFFKSLEISGLELKRTFSFPDHHRYRNEDLHKIIIESAKLGEMLLVCTEKDYYKLPPPWNYMVGEAVMDFEFITSEDVVRQYVVKPIIRTVEDRRCTFPQL